MAQLFLRRHYFAADRNSPDNIRRRDGQGKIEKISPDRLGGVIFHNIFTQMCKFSQEVSAKTVCRTFSLFSQPFELLDKGFELSNLALFHNLVLFQKCLNLFQKSVENRAFATKPTFLTYETLLKTRFFRGKTIILQQLKLVYYFKVQICGLISWRSVKMLHAKRRL